MAGRSFRPDRARKKPRPPQALRDAGGAESVCDFCPTRRLETPPEKRRWWRDPSGVWKETSFRPASLLGEGPCDFRRIANLFEIVPFEYWGKNLGFRPPQDRVDWMNRYLSEDAGERHVRSLLKNKLRKAGWDEARLATLHGDALRAWAQPLFFGSHDLIVTEGHYRKGALHDQELLSSGDLDPDAHHQYMLAALETAQDILLHNPLARHVAVFQNWLSPAGASFEHLHKQVLGCDVPGPYPEALARAARREAHFFQRRFLDPALEQGWLIAENAHATAISAFGTPYPAVWVFSKHPTARPWELSPEAFRGFSDLLHACHAASGPDTPTNEEWHYAPPQMDAPIPFHVTLKWRVNVHAGFEGLTGVYVSPLDPGSLRERLVTRLRDLKSIDRLGNVEIPSRA